MGSKDFERCATGPQAGLVGEMLRFLAANRKWWLLPILIVLGLVGLFIALTTTPVAPFIYALF